MKEKKKKEREGEREPRTRILELRAFNSEAHAYAMADDQQRFLAKWTCAAQN